MIKNLFFCGLSILFIATLAEGQASRVSNRNSSLTVNAGSAQTVTLPAPATLAGSVVALPRRIATPPSTTSIWTVTGGPGAVSFANPAAASTSATFSSAGVYVLTLTATTSTKLTTHSSITVTVNPAVVITPIPPVVVTPPAPATGTPNKLAWDPVSGADGYNLYRTDGACDDLSTFQKANAQLITAIPYSDPPGTAGAWCYYVRAVNSAGEGPASNVIWIPTR